MQHSGSNWSNTPPPQDQSCNHSAEACNQINDPGMAAHKEREEATGNSYHKPPMPGEGVEYSEEN